MSKFSHDNADDDVRADNISTFSSKTAKLKIIPVIPSYLEC